MGDETLLGTVEQAMASTPLPGTTVQATMQTESSEPTGAEPVEPTGTALDKPVQDENLEALRKQLLGDYTRKTQEIAPLRRLIQEQGVTLDEIQSALQLNRAFRENPVEFARLLQAMTNLPSEPASQNQPQTVWQQSVGKPSIQEPEPDPLAPLAEAYDESLVNPMRRIYEVAKQAQQTVLELQQQLQKEREEREKENFAKAVMQAETELNSWLQKNSHLGLTINQMRPVVARMLGREGLMAGVSPADFEAAALKVLGTEKYQELVYAQQLKREREKLAKTVPGPVVNPTTPTGVGNAPEGPGFENPKSMLEAATEYFKQLVNSGG